MIVIRLCGIACCLLFASCAGYVRDVKPAAVVSHGATCDLVYEVKTRRCAVDLGPRAWINGAQRRPGPWKVTLTNHGEPFGVFVHSWGSDPWSDWSVIRSGETRVLTLSAKDIGFQASACANSTASAARTPIRATITFHGLPAGLERNELIESGGGL